MMTDDSRGYMKKICCLSSLVRLCAIPLNLALSQALARAVSSATQGDVQAVLRQSIWTLVFALLLFAIGLAGQIALQKRALRALNRARLAFLERVLGSPLPRLFGADHGELLENLNDDIEASSARCTRLWPTMLAGLLTAVAYVLYLLPKSPAVAATLMGISLLQLIPPALVKRYMQINYDDCREIESKITDRVVEAVAGFETIRMYGLGEWWLQRMAALHRQYVVVGNRSEATATAQISMGKLLDNILKYGTYALLGVYAMFGVCPMETAVLGIALSPSLYEAMKLLFSVIPSLAVARTADARLAKWDGCQAHCTALPEDGRVSLRDVACGYGAHRVLDGVSREFDADKTYLFEGMNGSGKSTLMHLMAGLLRPERGAVLVGNVPPSELAEVAYPGDLLFIPQADPEFDLTAEELCKMLAPRRTDDFAQTAARLGLQPDRVNACAIRELSGGERKKAILTLAFSLNPRILLLDEPTNHLDPQAQSALCALIRERSGATFLISHDPQCRAAADEVLTIANGGIRHAACE